MAALNEGGGLTGLRIGIFIQKCLDGESHQLITGKTAVITGMTAWNNTIKGERQQEITGNFGSDIKTGKDFNKFMKPAKPNTRFITSTGDELAIGQFLKTEEYKGGKVDYNKGNVAEIIFAAAIFARFTNRTARVTEQQVKDVIFSDNLAGQSGTMFKMAPNEGVDIMDEVELRWGMSGNNHRAVRNKNLWPVWSLPDSSGDNIVSASLNYANSPNVVSWANLVYKNRSYNEIKILAEGELDQKATKVDVRVTITDQDGIPEPVNINVSLKKGNVGQFGQFGGVSYDVQKLVWMSSFGIEPPLTREEYEKEFKTVNHVTDTAVAFQKMYKAVVPVVKKLFEDPTSYKNSVQTFATFIKQQVTLGEDAVTLVTLKKDYAVEYNVDNVTKMMENLEFKFEYYEQTSRTEGDFQLPGINIYALSKGETKPKLLLTIRAKRGEKARDGTPYYRNIFEKKALFTDLFATILKATDV